MEGWIKLYRQIKESWLWEEKPFDKKSAWIDLLLSASHKDTKFPLGSQIIELKRGSFVTSELKLMERWGWSKSKVRSFLKLLKNESMIEIKTDSKKTTINIVNYGIYQELETTEEPQKNHIKTTKEPQKDTIKNVKNVKNENNSSSSGISKIFTFFNSNINLITPYQVEIINQFIDDGVQPELILKAMQDSLSARNKWSYLNSILTNCLKDNIFTLEQYNIQSSSKSPPQDKKIKSSNPFLDLIEQGGKNNET